MSPAVWMRPRTAAKAKPLAFRTANIRLYGRVGSEPESGISVAGVARALADAKAGGARALLIELNSGVGGGVNAAFQVVAVLQNYPGHVVGFLPYGGRVVSAAAIIALGMDYVVADPTASLMIHEATGGDDSILGSARIATRRIADLLAERSTLGSAEAVHGLLTGCGDTLFNAWEALGQGLVDEIGDEHRALEVAHMLARAHPLWPEEVASPRHSALAVREAMRKAARRRDQG